MALLGTSRWRLARLLPLLKPAVPEIKRSEDFPPVVLRASVVNSLCTCHVTPVLDGNRPNWLPCAFVWAQPDAGVADASRSTRPGRRLRSHTQTAVAGALADAGIGAGRGRKLVEHFGAIDRLFAASLTELEACGLPAAAAQSIALGKSLELAAAEYDRMREMGAAVIVSGRCGFPPDGCWRSTIRRSCCTLKEAQKSLSSRGLP